MAYEKVKEESYANLGGINSKVSPYVNGPTEFRDLVNVNFTTPGALTKRSGTSFYLGATVAGRIASIYEFERLNGASYLIATANTNAYTFNPSGYTAFKTGLLNGGIFDFVTFVDRVFMANGQDFFKFDGTNTTNYGLPAPPAFGLTTVAGGSLAAGVTTTFYFSYGYLNDAGNYGPGASAMAITVSGTATDNTVRFYGLTALSGYGISALAFYRSTPGGNSPVGTTLGAVASTTFDDPGYPLGTFDVPVATYFTLIPKYLEIYNNQLFMAGFSGFLSLAAWSDIGDPETVQPENNAEFRTNDGDKITGLKSYGGALVVTKERSTHIVTGDDPENFLLKEVSDQYGCLSNRAMVVWESKLWFLDSVGIVEFDGANISIISDKIEPLFQTMNVSAARETAAAIHYRDMNEVWFAIPVEGSTKNNCVVVYDYNANAWTTYRGVDISSLAMMKGALSAKSPFFGGYTGSVGFYGASLTADLGQGISCVVDSRYLAQTGQSTQRMYRRFYINIDSVAGVTQPITINFRQDYGSSIVLTRTMYQAPFQSRIDYGISAKSLQAEIGHFSASLPFRLYGFTFESRFLRPV